MKMKNLIIAIAAVMLIITSCEPYEDYVTDYSSSIVYFGTDKPLRTVIARDADMQIKLGVVLAGRRENTTEEWVSYVIDTAMLAGTGLVLLPENYYSLSNTDKFIIPVGKVLGEVVMTINHDLFTADPNATLKHYALPLRLLETSVDSINSVKDSTIVAIKYVSQNGGFYYRKGVRNMLDANGAVVETLIFRNKDLSKNDVWKLQTIAVDSLVMSKGSVAATSPDVALKIKLSKSGEVSIGAVSSAISISETSSTFDKDKREFYLNYKYTQGGNTYSMIDTLIQRQDPEKDLRFEEW